MLRKQFIYISLFALTIFIPSKLLATAIGVVTAKTLNVRVRPTTQFSVTGKLRKGDHVVVLKREGDWYMISAPANSSVWVSRAFINGDTITKRVNLRCGPSVAFKKYTTVNPGLKVVVLDNSNKDWVKIAPPKGLAVYVNAQFVSIIKPPTVAHKKDPVKSKITPTEQPTKTVQKLKKKTVSETANKGSKKKSSKISNKFANMTLEELLNYHAKEKVKKDKNKFVKQIKKTVSFQGYLLPLAKPTPVATHCIAIKVHNKFIKTCFIYTDNYNLSLWENRKVSVKGQQHWVKGWIIPVVEAESIRPVWN